jgi:hypothetical protein
LSSFRLTTAHCRRWQADHRSAAALEFALVAPLLIMLAGGVYDLCQAVLIYNEVTNAATMIADSASSAAVNLDGSTALSYDEVQLAESGIWSDIPELRNGLQAGQVKSITITSVDFEPPSTCTTGSNCNPYTAYVMWSVSYNGGPSGASFANNIRTCSPTGVNSDGLGGEKQVAASTGLSASTATYTLPVAGLTSYQPDPTGPAPVLVADVVFSYAPLLDFVKTSFTFEATALWPVRSVKPVQAQGNSLPLSQQFTKLYGVVSGTTFTPYAAPAATTVPTSTPETDAVAGTYCINNYQNAPYPYTVSST